MPQGPPEVTEDELAREEMSIKFDRPSRGLGANEISVWISIGQSIGW